MGTLGERIAPRRIAHQEDVKPPQAPPLSGGMPPLFVTVPPDAPVSDWEITQPWRKCAPRAYVGTRRACAYCDNAGVLYIGTPPGFNTLTVYTSVEAYNQRSEVPRFIPPEEAPADELVRVELSPHTLHVENNTRNVENKHTGL